MTDTIQNIYFLSASIGILAMLPQIRKLIIVKQSDGLSLTTWGIWACCQMVSFIYAMSINAKAYMIVGSIWICFYWTMVFLIIKYRKRRNLLETFLYWKKRGNEDQKPRLPFYAPVSLTVAKNTEKQ